MRKVFKNIILLATTFAAVVQIWFAISLTRAYYYEPAWIPVQFCMLLVSGTWLCLFIQANGLNEDE